MYVDIRDKCVAKLAILSSLEKTISKDELHSHVHTLSPGKKAAKDELHCYVHTLSAVKKAASSGRQYFHCTLQTETKVVRAVCFSPENKDNRQYHHSATSPKNN